MDNTFFMIWIGITFLLCALVFFAVFSVGFLIGYKTEDRRATKAKNKLASYENAEEQKIKKEWKKFLEYDGSTPQERI